MKFLLAAVNAKYIHSNPAIYSLRAYAGKELQKSVELAEYTINQPTGEILADLYRRKPDVIGFSCYLWNWRLIQELLEEAPKLLPGTELWLGGPEVSYGAPEIVRKYTQLSGIMVGEGEAVFKELLEFYLWRESVVGNGGTDAPGRDEPSQEGDCRKENPLSEETERRLHKIAGLCLPEGYTACRPPINMNEIPFLYENLEPFENRIIYYESSRGCPYRCSYCLSSVDRTLRIRDIDVIKKELQFFLDNRVKQVKFVDRTFNCNHRHAMEIWRYLYENDNGVTNFHFEISADILREEEIELLNKLRPGLVQLEIGVQSVNPDTIRAIQRVMDVDRLERAVEAIRRGQNVHVHLDLIAGLPFEDYESFRRSFDRVYHMKPQQLQLGFLKVLKGTLMYEKAEEYGICYTGQPPYEVLYTNWLSYGDVLCLKKVEEMVELYYNSGQFRHTLTFLERAFEGPFALYEALGDFYEEKGYFLNSPARAYRYRVLYEFACQCDGAHSDAYRELLVYDMYLRENLKSRPDFATELSPYKDFVRGFYQREEEERRYLPDYRDYDGKQLGRMTHMEPFFHAVWDAEGLGDECDITGQLKMSARFKSPDRQPFFVLFDYRRRSPLNGDAAVQVIPAGAEPESRKGI